MGLISRVSGRTYRRLFWSMFRSSFVRQAAKAKARPVNNKQTTNIYGLAVEPYALDKLPNVLNRTLSKLQEYPKDSHYAQMMTKYTREQLKLVSTSKDVPNYEKRAGRQIEEALQQARYELNLANEMIKYQIWEPLVEEAPEGQWKWP